MIFAKVTGTVVATRKDEKIEGNKLLVVQPISMKGKEEGSHLVAIDAVGAGVGEVVLIAKGSSARQTVRTKDTPTDAVVMAIIDTIETEGKILFQKS
jgi:microcompartment protein CcmK/EutM